MPAGAGTTGAGAAGAAGAAAAGSAGAGGATVGTARVTPNVATTVPPPRPVSPVPSPASASAPAARTDPVQRSAGVAPVWVAEAMPPPPDSMEAPSRRTARVAIETGADPAAGAAGVVPPDATVAAVAVTSAYPSTVPPATGTGSLARGAQPTPGVPPTTGAQRNPGPQPNPGEVWPVEPDSDAAAELAASMARTDLIVEGDAGSGVEPHASTASDDEGTSSPPWSRGRPRVPMDAGAPASLGPQTRPGARASGPREWEGGRRFEAYAARAGSGRPGRPVLIAIGAVLVAVALMAVFLLPSMFHGGGAAPTVAPTSAGSGVVATPRPKPTPTSPGATPAGPAPTPGSYRIKRGDTLSSIGRKFNVTVAQLTCANSIRNPNSLTTGTTLVIPIETYKCPRPTKKPKG